MDSACALLADINPASSHKSAFKIRAKIQPNLVEYLVAILAEPGRFMDSACALLADIVPASSHKSAFKICAKIQPNLDEFWAAILANPKRFLNKISIQNSCKNSTKLDEYLVAILAEPGRFMDSACALLADINPASSHSKFAKKKSIKFR